MVCGWMIKTTATAAAAAVGLRNIRALTFSAFLIAEHSDCCNNRVVYEAVDTNQETFESLQWPHTEGKKREAMCSGNMSSYGVHFTSLYDITPVTEMPQAQNCVLHENTLCPFARQANTKQRRRDD